MGKKENAEFVKQLQHEHKIETPSVLKAFLVVDRMDFMPEGYESDAYLDVPVSLYAGMTTSQPGTIAFMLEKLQIIGGEKILEIGAGSGYMTAILAHTTGPSGKVIAFEYIDEIEKLAEENLKKYHFKNILLMTGDGKDGFPKEAPYDVIVSSADAMEVPVAWKDQLIENGRILTPFGRGIILLKKTGENQYVERRFPGFAFVPLK